MAATRTALVLAAALRFGGWVAAAAPAEAPRKLKADAAQEYFLYLPKNHDPKQECALFVAVHASGGNGAGACGWSKLADEARCIVLAPTFKGDYKNPAKGSGDKLKAIIRELASECRLGPKLFLTGFADGAAFAHRFALDNPSMVLGCAPHSATEWAPPDPRARSVPFLITCGQDDKQGSRLANAQKAAKALKDAKFDVQTSWLKGVGHTLSQPARDKTKDFFLKLTTGMNAWERQKAQASMAKANAALKAGKLREAIAAAQEVLELKPNAEFTEKATAAIRQATDAAKAKLAKAEEQAKTDPQAAINALHDLHDEFIGTPLADAAAARAKALERAAAEGPKPTEEASEKEPAKEADTAAIRAQVRQWFALAENYVANGQTGQARLLMHKIIATYPGTDHAARAQAKLDELR